MQHKIFIHSITQQGSGILIENNEYFANQIYVDENRKRLPE
jgi:hypothetical protein